MFEIFVETILASTLYRVANESWAPTGEDPSQTLRAVDLAPGFEVALVELRVDLTTAFDKI